MIHLHPLNVGIDRPEDADRGRLLRVTAWYCVKNLHKLGKVNTQISNMTDTQLVEAFYGSDRFRRVVGGLEAKEANSFPRSDVRG